KRGRQFIIFIAPIRNVYGQKQCQELELDHVEGMHVSVDHSQSRTALLAYPAFALGADQAPDVKGKWIGKTHTILVGKGGHWPKGRGTWDKPAMLEKDLVFDITGQEGRRFWGVTTISGSGEKTDEPSSANSPARTPGASSSPIPPASGMD